MSLGLTLPSISQFTNLPNSFLTGPAAFESNINQLLFGVAGIEVPINFGNFTSPFLPVGITPISDSSVNIPFTNVTQGFGATAGGGALASTGINNLLGGGGILGGAGNTGLGGAGNGLASGLGSGSLGLTLPSISSFTNLPNSFLTGPVASEGNTNQLLFGTSGSLVPINFGTYVPFFPVGIGPIMA